MKYKKIGELTTVVTGGTPSTAKAEYWDDGTIPWLQSGCCQNCDVLNTEKYITQVGYDNSSAKMMPVNTVMIALTGATAGKIGYLRFEACGNQSITGILPCDSLNQDYLFYYLLSQRSKILADCIGGAQPHISQGYVKNMNIPVPSLKEQSNVANILSKVSKVIDSRRIEIKKLDELIKARFVEMFGNPVINSRKWKTEELNSIAPISNFSGNLEDKVWLLNLDMIEPQTGRIIDYLYVSIDEVGSSTCKYDTDNVLYSKLRPYLNKVVIPDRSGYATSELVPLRPKKSKLNRVYLAFLLRSNEFVNMINEKVAGAKMPRVSMTELKKFRVPVPPIELQNEFAEFTKQVDKSRAAIQKSIDLYQELFDKLMNDYFGEGE